MIGVSRIVIEESMDAMQILMPQQVKSGDKGRVQFLYLLKSQQAESQPNSWDGGM
jgi:hypothetical protein